jgi:predicted lipoprotein with Yx(FWY)xxD motif
MNEKITMTQAIVSTKTLLKSTIAATIIALIVFVVFILPAEYNIDPTHIGHKLGLTALAHHDDEATPQADISANAKQGQQVIEVTVPAGKGIEYKFQMAQYEKMTYEWITDGEPLYFDLHGEPQGDTTGYFESYAIATLNAMKGSFTSPFAGSHGWYWKNNSDKPVAIQLIVEGQYEVIGLK